MFAGWPDVDGAEFSGAEGLGLELLGALEVGRGGLKLRAGLELG
jgi:hypothetical protein